MTWRCDSAAVSVWVDKIMCCWWRPEFAVQHNVASDYGNVNSTPSSEGIVSVQCDMRAGEAVYLKLVSNQEVTGITLTVESSSTAN